MRFHLRRALVYLLASIMLVGFLALVAWDDATKEDAKSRKRNHQRLSRAELAKWDTVVIPRNLSEPIRVSDKPDLLIPFASSSRSRHLWPEYSPGDDRISTQLSFIPSNYHEDERHTKVIYVPAGLGETPEGREKFISDECMISNCRLSTNRTERAKANALLYQSGAQLDDSFHRPPNQIWIMWVLESPMNTMDYSFFRNQINWTATYRRDSTIVTPYEKWVPFQNASYVINSNVHKNYAAGKSKMAAWFVSNCGAKNQRNEFVEELEKHISVDVYGACGPHVCLRNDESKCFEKLKKEYRFYLSFENSNCQDYITEKFFWNALLNDVVPVVLGARKEDYLSAAPPNSFIHIEDFSSAQELAKHLTKVSEDDALYNEYFRWKGSGSFINTKFWCRLCTLLHTIPSEGHVSWYDNFDGWWRGPKTCSYGRWDNSDDFVNDWSIV